MDRPRTVSIPFDIISAVLATMADDGWVTALYAEAHGARTCETRSFRPAIGGVGSGCGLRGGNCGLVECFRPCFAPDHTARPKPDRGASRTHISVGNATRGRTRATTGRAKLRYRSGKSAGRRGDRRPCRARLGRHLAAERPDHRANKSRRARPVCRLAGQAAGTGRAGTHLAGQTARSDRGRRKRPACRGGAACRNSHRVRTITAAGDCSPHPQQRTASPAASASRCLWRACGRRGGL